MKKRTGKSGKKTFLNAISLQQDGEYEAAIRLYRKILREEPSHTGALMNLGALSFAEGRNREAISLFDKLLRAEPDNADAHYNRGKALLAMDKSLEAELSLKEALKLNPDDIMTVREYCSCCLVNEKPEQVIECTDDLKAEIRNNEKLITVRAEAFLQMGRFDEAKESLSRLVKSQPDCTAAYVLMSKVHFCARDFGSALIAMKRAVLAEPTNAIFRRELGIIYSIQGEKESAKLAFDEASRLDPDLKIVTAPLAIPQNSTMNHWDDLALQMYLMDRMRYWASRSEWRGAVNELLILSRKYAGKPSILQELAAAYQLNEEPKRARNLYLQLLEQEPENLEARLQLCSIELDLDNGKEALSLSSDMVRDFPELVNVLVLRGRALWMSGQPEEATTVLEKALTLAPNTYAANLTLGKVLIERKRYGEAVDVLEHAVHSGGTFSGIESLSALSYACRKSGDRSRLRRILEDAVMRLPGSLTATVELAGIFLECNMAEEARKYYRRATTFKAGSLDEAIFLAEAHIFCRSLDDVARIIRNLKRKGCKRAELLLFDALLQTINGKACRDSIAWQRLWRESASLPVQRIALIRTVLTPGEQEGLIEDLAVLKKLFATSSEIASEITTLADELNSNPRLELITSSPE